MVQIKRVLKLLPSVLLLPPLQNSTAAEVFTHGCNWVPYRTQALCRVPVTLGKSPYTLDKSPYTLGKVFAKCIPRQRALGKAGDCKGLFVECP